MCFSYTFNVDRFLWRLKSKLEMSIVISSRSRVTKKTTTESVILIVFLTHSPFLFHLCYCTAILPVRL